MLNMLQNNENLVLDLHIWWRERGITKRGDLLWGHEEIEENAFFFLILQNFRESFLLPLPGFCFHPDFPADSSDSSHGNLSFWKPWNLVYWLLSIANCLLLGKEAVLMITVIESLFFLYSYTVVSNLICCIGRVPYKDYDVLFTTLQNIVAFYRCRVNFSFSHTKSIW